MDLHFYKTGSGKPLIILHGLFGQSDNWMTLAKQWAVTHTVYVIDLRNHGKSFHSKVFTIEAMATDVVNFIKTNQLSDVTLLGHSLGGKVAMYIALHYQFLSKLIVVDIAPRYYAPHHQQIIDGLLAVPLQSIITRNMAETYLMPYIKDFGTRQFLLKNLYWQTETQLAWRFNLNDIANSIQSVGQEIKGGPVQLPALFIRGGKSAYINEADVQQITSMFTNAIFKTAQNAGHWVHAEAMPWMYEIVNEFLQS
jgi:esterase